jgi:methionyl-tRNA formyltransferase
MVQHRLRIVFFGTAEFAVPSLEALIDAGHTILAVVTQPDKPTGRGLQQTASPVKQAALRYDLPVLQPRRVRAESFLAQMRALAPNALALAAFGQIIPQALLDLPPLGPINVHGSLLPRYRGAAPIQRAIMAGDTETGVTTMWMEATLDTGDILLAEALPIAPDDTTGTLIPKLAALGARLLVETLEGLAAGTLERRPQDHTQATFAPAIRPEDSILRWEEPARAIDCRIRGMSPKPGAFTQIRDRKVKIWRAQETASHPLAAELPPGTVIGIQKNPSGVLVVAGERTTLLVSEAQPDSGKRMAAADWARGLHLQQGDRFAS